MQLYTYQQEGADFLAGRTRAYLADGMGLGKTVQAAAGAAQADVRRALWVGPASTLANSEREWERWGPKGSVLVTASYDRIARYPGDYYGPSFDLIVIDEAHYCKNPDAKRTKAVLNIARLVKHAWLLSGSPVPNNAMELWAPIRVLWPEIPRALGIDSAQEWLNRFCRYKRTPFGVKVFGIKNGSALRPHLKAIMLRRTLDDVALELPPLRVDTVLLPRDQAFDAALTAQGFDADAVMATLHEHEGREEPGALPKLRRLLGEAKTPAIIETLKEELESKSVDKIVVLAYHHTVMDMLRDGLKKFGVTGFDGNTPVAKRQGAIDAFTTGYERVFVGQQSAAGIGINLQAASEVVLVEPAWSPEDNAQALKRIHRIGQTRPCRARIFAFAGSLDEAVMDVCARKVRMQLELGL
jgi:SWI/SNF-related matrix-associated actin-dependent regulator of chromatin subfamily A-like protein 1